MQVPRVAAIDLARQAGFGEARVAGDASDRRDAIGGRALPRSSKERTFPPGGPSQTRDRTTEKGGCCLERGRAGEAFARSRMTYVAPSARQPPSRSRLTGWRGDGVAGRKSAASSAIGVTTSRSWIAGAQGAVMRMLLRFQERPFPRTSDNARDASRSNPRQLHWLVR